MKKRFVIITIMLAGLFSAAANAADFGAYYTKISSSGNPCFVIKNWSGNNKASLKIDGMVVCPGKNFRQGIIRDTDGTRTLVIWIKAEFEKPVDVSISAIEE